MVGGGGFVLPKGSSWLECHLQLPLRPIVSRMVGPMTSKAFSKRGMKERDQDPGQESGVEEKTQPIDLTHVHQLRATASQHSDMAIMIIKCH